MDGGEARGPERRWAEISIERRIQASVKPPRALVDSTTWADVSELSAFGDGTADGTDQPFSVSSTVLW